MSAADVTEPLPVEERLYADEHRPDSVSHLTLTDQEQCIRCAERECTRVCAAETHRWEADSHRLTVSFENCLECGACRLACPYHNIEWRYPMGGMGICYRYG